MNLKLQIKLTGNGERNIDEASATETNTMLNGSTSCVNNKTNNSTEKHNQFIISKSKNSKSKKNSNNCVNNNQSKEDFMKADSAVKLHAKNARTKSREAINTVEQSSKNGNDLSNVEMEDLDANGNVSKINKSIDSNGDSSKSKNDTTKLNNIEKLDAKVAPIKNREDLCVNSNHEVFINKTSKKEDFISRNCPKPVNISDIRKNSEVSSENRKKAIEIKDGKKSLPDQTVRSVHPKTPIVNLNKVSRYY